MGLLGDFAVGAAQAGEKVGLAQIQADIEENKRMRLAEFQEQLNIKSEARQEESVVRRENRGLLAATETRKQVNEETLTQRQKKFDQDNSAPNVQTSNQTAAAKARAAGDIGREQGTLDLQNQASPQNLAATRNIARAKDIDHGAGLRAIQIKSAQIELAAKQAEAKLPYAERKIAESLSAEIKDMQKSLVDADVKGTLDPEGAVRTREAIAASQKKLQSVYAPYVKERAESPPPFPEGVSKQGADGFMYTNIGNNKVRRDDGAVYEMKGGKFVPAGNANSDIEKIKKLRNQS